MRCGNPDYNNGVQDGFGYYQCSMKNGLRWSAAHAYLDPAKTRSNLRIETHAHARRGRDRRRNIQRSRGRTLHRKY